MGTVIYDMMIPTQRRRKRNSSVVSEILLNGWVSLESTNLKSNILPKQDTFKIILFVVLVVVMA